MNEDSTRKCCAPGCESSSNINVNLFRFPKDEPRCSIWKHLLGNPQYENYSSTECYNRLRLCNLHFKDEYFAGVMKTRLRKNAIPSFNYAFTENVEESPVLLTQPINIPLKELSCKIGTRCVVKCCNRGSVRNSDVSFFRFPLDLERCKAWATACGCLDLLESRGALALHKSFRVCGVHFEEKMFLNDLKNRLQPHAVPTLYLGEGLSATQNPPLYEIRSSMGNLVGSSNSQPQQQGQVLFLMPRNMRNTGNVSLNVIAKAGGSAIDVSFIDMDAELEKSQQMEPIRCRTCLNESDETTYKDISNVCFPNKSIKEVIILLVPKMASRLSDGDVVCSHCFKTLESSIRFILKCLLIEESLSKVRENVNGGSNFEESVFLNEYADVEGGSQILDDTEDAIGSEHNYSVKINYGEDDPLESDLTGEYDPISYYTNRANLIGSDDDELPSNEEILEDPLADYKIKLEETNSETRKRRKYTKRKIVTPRRPKNYKKKTEKKTEYLKTYSCLSCPETFTDKETYKLHLQLHPPHICETCGKAFAKKDSLKAHKVTHNAPNTFMCEKCGKGYKDVCALRVHLSTHSAPESHPCGKCSKTYRNKRALKKHVALVHNKSYQAQCNICGLVCTNPGTLNSHIKVVHEKEKPYECDICHARFGRKDYVRNHRLRHSNDRVFSDDGQIKKRLRYRMRIINNTKIPGVPLTCKFCHQSYKDMVRLKRHLETHLKRFTCQFCPLSFSSKAICKRHAKIHREGDDNTFRCNTCWKRFATKEILDRHSARHDKPRYACDQCGKPFNRIFMMNHHKLMDHSGVLDRNQAKEIILDSLDEVVMEVGDEKPVN